jgi:hypothetical protein
MTTINDIWDAYEAATGQWRGCNWSTHYGSLSLDLDGISSGQAQRTADHWRALAGDELTHSEVTACEEATLVDMALHLKLRGAVAYGGEDQHSGLEVCGNQARRFCAETLTSEWEHAVDWLGEIESDARWAEDEAREAVRAAEDGDWEHALGHAHQACSIESGYDAPRPWEKLERVVEKAAR